MVAVDPLLLNNVNTVTENKNLRILPIGDSITLGVRSSDYNGYRRVLWQDLSDDGFNVTYIGSQTWGDLGDNAVNEGHGGATIRQIAAAGLNTLRAQPNVVLVHAGTNDLDGQPLPEPMETAPERLGLFLDEILCVCPQATVIVAKIIQCGKTNCHDKISWFNTQVPQVVDQRRKKGFKVATVDMTDVGDLDWKELEDGLHPNDHGYERMGHWWHEAIQQAQAKGWIDTPREVYELELAQDQTKCAYSTLELQQQQALSRNRPFRTDSYEGWIGLAIFALVLYGLFRYIRTPTKVRALVLGQN